LPLFWGLDSLLDNKCLDFKESEESSEIQTSFSLDKLLNDSLSQLDLAIDEEETNPIIFLS
jgi:hypothetical protein